MPLILGIIAMLFIVLDILAITGGINAIQRKNWGVAFAGSIAAIFTSQLLGIFSLIFIALSKRILNSHASFSAFGKRQREIPGEADTISHQLLLKAGMINQLAAGIYSYLPLAWRTMRKIENIVREEMDKAEGQEDNAAGAASGGNMAEKRPRSSLWRESVSPDDRKNGNWYSVLPMKKVMADLVAKHASKHTAICR